MARFIVKLSIDSKGERLDLGYLAYSDTDGFSNTHNRDQAYSYHTVSEAEGGLALFLQGLEAAGWHPGKPNLISAEIIPHDLETYVHVPSAPPTPAH